jgi:DnaJ family protein C protein 2
VLERNARWAVVQPMPGLGDSSTPIEEVLEMYDKWFNFESWRDFTLDLEDAFDLDEASCREERRWMERQTKKNVERLQVWGGGLVLIYIVYWNWYAV